MLVFASFRNMFYTPLERTCEVSFLSYLWLTMPKYEKKKVGNIWPKVEMISN